MKKEFQKLALILLVAMLSAGFCSPAMAASKKPGRVTGLKAVAGAKRVKLTWNQVDDATGYYVYMKSKVNGRKKLTKVETIKPCTKTKCTVTGLKLGESYTFYVVAFRRVKGKKYEAKRSKLVKVTTKLQAPDNPVVIGYSTNNTAYVTWEKVRLATGYIVYQKIGGKFRKVETTSKNIVKIEGLDNGTTYTFKVKAYRTIKGKTAKSKGTKINVLVQTLKKQVAAIVERDVYEVEITQTITVKRLNGKGSVTLYPGNHVGAVWKGYNYGDSYNDYIPEYFVLSDGTKTEGKTGCFNICHDLYWNHSKKYTKTAVEYFVNTSRPQSSKTNWMLWINYYTQYCYIFNRKKASSDWVLYGSWECSTGRYGMTQTPRGELQIVDKSPRYYFPGGGGAYGNYASHLTGYGNAIHGPRRTAGGVFMDPGEIGYPLSSGCVRLFEPYAKFVYDRCDLGTRVLVE